MGLRGRLHRALRAGLRAVGVRDEATDTWQFVPGSQYLGLYADRGGIARDEQEAALREIEADAARESDLPRWRE